MITNPCSTCGGSGRSRTRRKLTLRIPAGVETGSRIRLAGKGEGGVDGGPPGDLYVLIHVRPHDVFERRDEEVFCEVPIPFDVALLGGDVEVPTLQGPARLRIPAGTPGGKVFRLRGKGVVNVHSGIRGDQHVRIRVEVPQRLSGRQKKALEEVFKLLDDSHYPERKRFNKRVKAFYERKKALTR